MATKSIGVNNMAVSSVIPRVQYTAAAGQTEFIIPWKWFADEDIKAYSTAAGSEPSVPADNLVLNVDYSLTGTGVDAGGTLTLVTAAELDQTITIERDSIGDRPEAYDFKVAGTFTVEQLNKNFDKLSMGMQDNNMLIHNRMLLYPAVDTFTQEGDLILPKLENNEVWKKNENGKLIATVLEENDDWSTLRSELASESSTAPGTSIIGHYAGQLSSGEPLEDFLNRIDLDLRTDLAVNTEADAGSKLIGHYDEDTDANTTVYDKLQNLSSENIRSSFWGYNISNYPLAPTTYLEISKGSCVSRGGEVVIRSESGMSKRINQSWAAGSGGGGLPSALSQLPDYCYYVFVIMKEDKTVDFGFDDSLTATNLLADATGFIYYRRIGSFTTRNDSTIAQFFEYVQGSTKKVVLVTDYLDTDEAELHTTSITGVGQIFTINLKHVPVGHAFEAKMRVSFSNLISGGYTAVWKVYSDVMSNSNTDEYDVFDMTNAQQDYYYWAQEKIDIVTHNATIYCECIDTDGTIDTGCRLDVFTIGWTDSLDMDELI